MTDATADFFAELAQRKHEPLLRNSTGAIRFDLAGGKRIERWLLTIDRGDVAVSRGSADADAVLTLDKSLFEHLAGGEANAMTALLRGEIDIAGDLELAVTCQRIFPGGSTRGQA